MNENEGAVYKNFSDTCNAVHRDKLVAGDIYIKKNQRSQTHLSVSL